MSTSASASASVPSSSYVTRYQVRLQRGELPTPIVDVPPWANSQNLSTESPTDFNDEEPGEDLSGASGELRDMLLEEEEFNGEPNEYEKDGFYTSDGEVSAEEEDDEEEEEEEETKSEQAADEAEEEEEVEVLEQLFAQQQDQQDSEDEDENDYVGLLPAISTVQVLVLPDVGMDDGISSSSLEEEEDEDDEEEDEEEETAEVGVQHETSPDAPSHHLAIKSFIRMFFQHGDFPFHSVEIRLFRSCYVKWVRAIDFSLCSWPRFTRIITQLGYQIKIRHGIQVIRGIAPRIEMISMLQQ